MQTVDKKQKFILRVLYILAGLASLKSIFVDTGYDNAYMLAMSYRHLRGDHMFLEMWEPHQTSIFVNDLLMWLYHLIVPSYTGVMIYLQIAGTVMLLAAAVLLVKILEKQTNPFMARLGAVFFFMFRAKQSPFPDYSNLSIIFSVLLLYFLLKFINDQSSIRNLIVAGLMLCAEVLCYPSCAIAYLGVCAILLAKTDKKGRNILLFTLTCGITGLAYVAFFALKIGPKRFMDCIDYIIHTDTHGNNVEWISNYLALMKELGIWLVAAAALSGIVCFVITKLMHKKAQYLDIFGTVLVLTELIMLFFYQKTQVDWDIAYFVLTVVIIALGLVLGYRKMNKDQHTVWLCGVLISLSSFFAAIVLSDLGLISMLSYLVLAAAVSVIPLSASKVQTEGFMASVCMLVVLHVGLVVWGYGSMWGVHRVYELKSIVRSGPTAGLVTDYMTRAHIASTDEEFERLIAPEDNFLLVKTWIMDPAEFMLTDAKISNPTTIDALFFTETFFKYYEVNPDRVPTVVVTDCWFGTERVPEDSLIMQWVRENYEWVADGNYWRYYRKRLKDN